MIKIKTKNNKVSISTESTNTNDISSEMMWTFIRLVYYIRDNMPDVMDELTEYFNKPTQKTNPFIPTDLLKAIEVLKNEKDNK